MTYIFKKLGLLFWAAVPGLITFVCVVLYLVPKHISGLGSFMPMLPMIPIFYWGLNDARVMPYWVVFAFGLIIDSITGLPLGLSAISGVFFLASLRAQHKYIHREGFVVQWGYFALLLAVTGLLHWALLWGFFGQIPGLKYPLIQWLLTVCCYPLCHQMFAMISDTLARRQRKIR